MSVRWKPMILLSVLFVLVAALGLMAIMSALVPGGAQEILPLARAEVKAKKYDRAKIQFERALQRDPKDAAIHEELAAMLAEWSKESPAMRAKLRPMWLHALNNAAKYGKQRIGPRKALLADALRREEPADCLFWAKDLIVLDPKDPDACFVLAADALNHQPPNVSEARKKLAILDASEPERTRTTWIRARIAEVSNDDEAIDAALTAFHAQTRSSDPVDQIARLELLLMDLRRASALPELSKRVNAFRTEVGLIGEDEAAPGRIRKISQMLELAQRHLTTIAARQPEAKDQVVSLETALEMIADQTYGKAIEAAGETDLRPYQAYAEYLLFRGHRERCLEIVGKALKCPAASLPSWLPTTMELREVAIKCALSDPADPARFEKAAPFIKDLLASTTPRYKALGHLFQGVIDLERSGLAVSSSGEASDENARKVDSKLLAPALAHLKAAATDLPDVATAQALYGVALILTKEPALGRQYLQAAQRLGAGNLDPRYQIWAAWSVLQAGYPEEAEPIVSRLLAQVASGEVPADLQGMLLLLQGEIHQARKTPSELRNARESYQKAIAAGQAVTPALKLRMAQIDAMLGDASKAMREIEQLQSQSQAGPSAEQLAVLTLKEQGKTQEANQRLDAARTRYPDSPELAGLDAALRLTSGHPDQAETVLADFLKAHPDQLELTLMRARILAGPLKKPDEARSLLVPLAEKAESSAPLVQLALLDLSRKDFEAVARSITQIRSRWKEAAAADLLDAQLALAQGNPRTAATHLEAALKKDPKNKVALFWKAQLDDLAGSGAEAQRVYESILRDRPVKELDSGLPLTAAAQWALATMDLEKQDYDRAITRFEDLLKDPAAAELARPTRWKLAIARAAKGDVSQAKSELEALLRDPSTTPDERVQAADFYRRYGDLNAASRQLDLVLNANPGHAGAVAYRALMLTSQGKSEEAATLIQKAISSAKQPPSLYLMLAGIENLDGSDPKSLTRALAALDEGLKAYPDSVELLKARYQVMTLRKDPDAVKFVEDRVTSNPNAANRRVLADVYREAGDYAKAENVVRDLLKAEPNDSPTASQLSAQLVGLVAAQAREAADRGDRNTESELNQKTASLIARYREQFPNDLAFPQLECDLALRTGDLARARRIAQEISRMDKKSPVGPLLKARLASTEGQLDEMARDYEEALERSPDRTDIRIALGRTRLELGQIDEALEQASAVLTVEREQQDALLLKAQALASRKGSANEVEAGRTEAIRLLQSVLKADPKSSQAYHLLAEIQHLQGRRDLAIQTLKTDLQAIPNDDAGLSILLQRLTEPSNDGSPPSSADLHEANAIAEKLTAKDPSGVFSLAAAVGFHKAGQVDLALPYARKAAETLDRSIVHLTYGDILLAKAESVDGSAQARDLFQQAVEQYDLVLKRQPDSIEAVNNKAWILHRYLGQNAEALELAEGLVRRADPSTLPAEFFDTLGAIREAVGKSGEAEAAYSQGLRKSPDHPILNFHMGRLLVATEKSGDEAVRCLELARKRRNLLPRGMAEEVDKLLAQAGR